MKRLLIYLVLMVLFVYNKLLRENFILTFKEYAELIFDTLILIVIILVAELREKIETTKESL